MSFFRTSSTIIEVYVIDSGAIKCSHIYMAEGNATMPIGFCNNSETCSMDVLNGSVFK